jgi:hypothetical protein
MPSEVSGEGGLLAASYGWQAVEILLRATALRRTSPWN